MTGAEPGERDTSASVLAALAGSSAIAALLVTAGMWAGFAWMLLWLIWLVALMAGTVVGLPLYLAAAALGRVNAWTAAGGGLAAGAALPLLFLLPGSETAPSILVGAIVAFSACGAVAGLVFLLILRWPRLSRSRRAAIGERRQSLARSPLRAPGPRRTIPATIRSGTGRASHLPPRSASPFPRPSGATSPSRSNASAGKTGGRCAPTRRSRRSAPGSG
jgi:hypothetical protein